MADCHRIVTSPRRVIEAVRTAPFDDQTDRQKGEGFMSLASHLEELQRKHGEIERQLHTAANSPSTDDLEIATLKRRKLALKDEIERLKGHTTH